MALLAGRRRLFALGFFAIALLYPIALYWYEIERTLASAASPLWSSDLVARTPGGPQVLLPHIYADALWITGEVCTLHGWDARPAEQVYEREVWDAVVLDSPTPAELDMLEIRLQELRDVVNKIFVVESNRTINGTPKELYFGSARFEDRFAAFLPKLVYRAVPAPSLDSLRSPPPDAWRARLHAEMTALMRTRASNTRLAPIVLFADADEVPSAHTLRLLRTCAFPAPLHLQLRRFAHAYEWPAGWDSWRAQVHVWDTGMVLAPVGDGAEARLERRRTEYSRTQVSEKVLADAGWQCAYCYKDIDDIIAKMQDDFGQSAASLTPEHVQNAICEGREILNNVPEYKEFAPLSSEPSKSAVGVPWYVVEAHHKYRHTLPGGCNRTVASQVQVQLPGKKDDEPR